MALASIDEHGVAVIEPVPSGLPTPVVPSLDHVESLLSGAFAIAIMVFLESVAVARSVRRRSEPTIDNDQELLATELVCVAGASGGPCRRPADSRRRPSTSGPGPDAAE